MFLFYFPWFIGLYNEFTYQGVFWDDRGRATGFRHLSSCEQDFTFLVGLWDIEFMGSADFGFLGSFPIATGLLSKNQNAQSSFETMSFPLVLKASNPSSVCYCIYWSCPSALRSGDVTTTRLYRAEVSFSQAEAWCFVMSI